MHAVRLKTSATSGSTWVAAGALIRVVIGGENPCKLRGSRKPAKMHDLLRSAKDSRICALPIGICHSRQSIAGLVEGRWYLPEGLLVVRGQGGRGTCQSHIAVPRSA